MLCVCLLSAVCVCLLSAVLMLCICLSSIILKCCNDAMCCLYTELGWQGMRMVWCGCAWLVLGADSDVRSSAGVWMLSCWGVVVLFSCMSSFVVLLELACVFCCVVGIGMCFISPLSASANFPVHAILKHSQLLTLESTWCITKPRLE